MDVPAPTFRYFFSSFSTSSFLCLPRSKALTTRLSAAMLLSAAGFVATNSTIANLPSSLGSQEYARIPFAFRAAFGAGANSGRLGSWYVPLPVRGTTASRCSPDWRCENDDCGQSAAANRKKRHTTGYRIDIRFQLRL